LLLLTTVMCKALWKLLYLHWKIPPQVIIFFLLSNSCYYQEVIEEADNSCEMGWRNLLCHAFMVCAPFLPSEITYWWANSQ
jgi:hypothetical protein